MSTTGPTNVSDPNVIPPSSAKDPILILILALFLGGIAYFVVGQWQKGIVALLLWFCGLGVSIVTCGVGVILFFPLVIAIVIDAYMQAQCLKDGHPIGQWTFFGAHV